MNVDLRSLGSPGAFDDSFYPQIQDEITDAFSKVNRDIETENNYALWEPLFHWTSKASEDARGTTDPTKYRGGLVTSSRVHVPPKKWVDLALKYITQQLNSSHPNGMPFTYLVLALDNLDQSDFLVQATAIHRVCEWLRVGSRVKFWRIFIPLWPTTLALMMRTLQPLPDNETIQLPPPLTSVLLGFRSRYVESKIQGLGRDTTLPNANADEADRVLGNEIIRDFLATSADWNNDYYRTFLCKLAGGSARQEILFWQWTLCSRSLLEHYLRLKAPQGAPSLERISYYMFLDALLTGKYSGHHAINNPVLNLFYILPDILSERHLLIGPHVLFLLERRIRSYEEAIDELRPVGYAREDVETVLNRFRDSHILQLEGGDTKRSFVLREDVLRAYLTLLNETAYVDQVAMVTPVAKDRLAKMKRTHSYDRAAFRARVETTDQFLLQLRDDEQAFCYGGSQPEGETGEFRSALNALKLPSVFKTMALKYRERLQNLSRRRFLGDIISPAEWETLLKARVFLLAESAEALLRPVDPGAGSDGHTK